MRFLIAGVGSIGQRHLKNLRLLGHEVLAYDADAARSAEVAAAVGVEVVDSLELGIGRKVDGLIVCTPPASHLSVARSALAAGIHVFVEKPLAPSLDGVAELLAEVAERRVHLLVGANLRFFRSLQRLRDFIHSGRIGRILSVRAQCGFYLPFWNVVTDYRLTYRTRAATGGGILLDAIHEFDYLRWIFGEVDEVFCTTASVGGFEIDVEDLAEVTLRFASGPVAQLHLDYLQRSYRRDCEVIGERGVIVWDYIRRDMAVFAEEPDRWEVYRDPIDANHNEMYVEEMRHFVRCLDGQEPPLIDGYEALSALRLIAAARTSSGRRQWVTP